MRSTLLILIALVVGCATRHPASIIHLAGFPNGHPATRPAPGPVVPPYYGGWSGTSRSFRANNGEVFYLQITIDEDYFRYCTARLEANGLTKFRVIKINQMLYLDGDKYIGYITRPDRVYISFMVEDREQGGIKEVRITYLLPESSRSPVVKLPNLSHDANADQYAEYVVADLKNIAEELVHKLKDA